MKKILLIVVMITLLLVITACSSNKDEEKSQNDETNFNLEGKDSVNSQESDEFKEISEFDLGVQKENEELDKEKDVTSEGNVIEIQKDDEINEFDLGVEKDSSTISEETLAMHSTENDCWISYDGAVYDVTEFLPKHPGSAAAIIPYCGTSENFASAFEGQHGTSKVGVLTKEGEYKGDLV